MNRAVSDLFSGGAGAGRVVGREEDEAVQEQRHLRVCWERKKKKRALKADIRLG